MLVFTFCILISIFHWALGQINSSAPNCALSCWENTKYVSKCLDDDACRCRETDYQDSLFQCLYSQCDTADFGSALHHTMLYCSSFGSEIMFSIPRMPNHDALRRREADYLAGVRVYGSGSAIEFPTQSANSYPTQSAGNTPTQSSGGAYSFTTSPPYFPLNTATGSVSTFESLTEEVANVVASSTTSPLLYTGPAPEMVPKVNIPVFVSLVALYMCL